MKNWYNYLPLDVDEQLSKVYFLWVLHISTLKKVLDSFNSVLSAQLSVAQHGWAAPVSCHKSWWWPSGAWPMEIGRSWWSQGPAHGLSHFRTFQWIFLLLANIFLLIMWKSTFRVYRVIPTAGDKQQIPSVSLHLHAKRFAAGLKCWDYQCWFDMWHVSQRWPPQIFPS